MTAAPSEVLLVGSIPLSSAEEVFTTVANSLPGRVRCIPDGETGDRGNYIGWQLARFPKETIQYFLGGTEPPADHPGFTLESIPPTEYDTVALKSYETFVELRKKNIIPPGVRFLVALPPPLACIQGHTRSEFHAQLEPLYEKRMLDSLANIIDKIPAEDLALQWDVCFEVTALEFDRGNIKEPFLKAWFSPVKEGILDRLERISANIPANVPLGFHLCYGDLNHQHFVEPQDTGLIVDLANSIAGRLKHPVDWVHLPVPKSRDDEAYFEPLKELNIGPNGRLYLGLVHPHDLEGTKRRIEVARSVVPRDFGVATECGMGRTPKEDVDSILQILKDVTVPV
ncbi:hypothetical protein C8Q69DRAFT_460604 [Paecilomyces variotii]|uniref:Cobalamin-independent methionine synthase MetE C-terminal/archaeal domain-containing protein n=1 Tax=Byssochlamys spectabilis TaxID=264951 RepID=A0A443HXS7_BYSSP|nr:hypothetical protein C8Q69DRAFT_460604 [Paecilomyces variotii]KAJ9223625.1 hypothetical protein DTO169C6_3977 [Paecilomyces variotii]KAJ9252887.1 hypothetical protein DTO195F2_7308 [Paecilomyces variotii]KAJ9260703.1 hypothetical protein DTO212C5_8430 [Paecilomyces variotii]KAJ9350894.1 hypothetical protein DTO280E4_8490 [Paecilomyces variotii]KAJ9384094.1 hypothetical protein DTO063F5_4827 [Paecilomyces variotii]